MDYEKTLNQILESFRNEGGCKQEDNPNGKCRLFNEMQCFYEAVKAFNNTTTSEGNTTLEQWLTKKKPKFKVGQYVYDSFRKEFSTVAGILARLDDSNNAESFEYVLNDWYGITPEGVLISEEEYWKNNEN